MYRSDDGWRARIGVLLPSVNTVVEQWFNKVVPEGVSVHAARMILKAATVEAAKEMSNEVLRAAAQLVDCRVDVIAYCCLAGSVSQGSNYDKELMKKIEMQFKLPCVTAATSILRAFKEFGIKKVVSFSPYTVDVHELEVKFFKENGINIVHSRLLGITNLHDLSEPSAGKIYRMAKATWNENPNADSLFMGCLNFRAHDTIQVLESCINKPVITGNQAILWAVLRLAGINDQIPGYGKLMLL